jgi:parallel beta-helix repeat protein
MKRILVGILIFMLLVGTAIPISGTVILNKQSEPTLLGTTLYVGSGSGHYTKIQDAIDAANIGDTIYVFDDLSPYKENLIIKTPFITIEGEHQDVHIDGGYEKSDYFTIQVEACNVKIRKFTINGTIIRPPEFKPKAIIKFKDSNLCTISNNKIIIDNETHGILLTNSSLNKICNNNIYCRYDNKKCAGISLQNSSHQNDISQNSIYKNKIGINITGKCVFNEIYQNNPIEENIIGILIENCNYDNIIRSNIINDNKDGINIVSSKNIEIINNIIDGNTDNGINLQYADHINITKNTVINNKNDENTGAGIHIRGKSNLNIYDYNSIISNTIQANDYGIYLLYSARNIIKENTIVENWQNINLINTKSNDIRLNIIKNSKDGLEIYVKNARNDLIYRNEIISTIARRILIEGSGIIIAPYNYWAPRTFKNGVPIARWAADVFPIFIGLPYRLQPFDYIY